MIMEGNNMNKYLKDNKGFVLITALAIMTLLLGLGSAAMTMSQLGYTAITAEKRYQLATWAADYGLMTGIQTVVNTSTCPTTAVNNQTIGSGSSQATYGYFGVQDSTGSYCFVKAVGTKGTSNVHKMMVVSNAGNTWGGIVTKGGNITLSGSSAIAGCDDDENTYPNKCGIMPAVITNPGSALVTNGSSTTLSTCQNEGTLSGFSGKPPIQNKDMLPADLTPRYFQVSDNNANGSAWDELMGLIESKYSNTTTTGVWRWIKFYDQTKSTTRFGLPVENAAGDGLIPTSPGNVWDLTFSGTPVCCRTTDINTITCYSNSNCSTGPLTPTINLSSTTYKPAQTTTNYNTYPYIAVGDDTVTYIRVNPTGTANKIVPSTDWQITVSGVRIAFTGGRPAGPANAGIKIASAINNIRIYTGGRVAINSNLSYTSGNLGSIIYAGGDVTFGANVGNHGADTCTAHTTTTDYMPSATHIISGGTVTITSQDIRNTNVFANNINVSSMPDVQGSKANIFYALNGFTINTNGSPCFGYPCGNNSNVWPVLILVGDGNPATGGSTISMPGNLTISGVIYTDATTVSITGAVEFQGTLINISTNTNITNTGNGTIQFNKKILDGLYAGLCNSIMQQPKCGGGNKSGYIVNTKTTIY